MRVIAGDARGRRLEVPRGRQVRPTSDRVREALFNILAPRVVGAAMLDLYAGSGSVGLEALSRGAARVVFVEADAHAAAVIRRNLDRIGQVARAEIRVQHVLAAVRHLGRQGKRFEIVFLDPPYGRDFTSSTLKAISSSGVLAPGGMVIAEHGYRDEVPARVEDLQLVRQNKYGEVALSFYQQLPLEGA